MNTTRLDAMKVSPISALWPLIGQTPLLEIHFTIDRQPRCIYAKYEPMNMTGSIKDRMAAHIFKVAYESGDLHPGDTIVEASSGNTGISFAAIGSALAHPVRIYIPDWMSHERVQLISTFGATVVAVSRQDGGFLGAIEMTKRYAESHENVFLPSQFVHPGNIEAHETSTGPEIESQLRAFGRGADAFVA